MSNELDLVREYEAHVIECLDLAIECGPETEPGRDAFHLGMQCLTNATELKSQLIYAPLAMDPATADYVQRLGDHRYELMESIDILRTYIELKVEERHTAPMTLERSLLRLRRRLQVLFRREAPLGPVFEAWQSRNTGADSMFQTSHIASAAIH